jgi:hypothetical protein
MLHSDRKASQIHPPLPALLSTPIGAPNSVGHEYCRFRRSVFPDGLVQLTLRQHHNARRRHATQIQATFLDTCRVLQPFISYLDFPLAIA